MDYDFNFCKKCGYQNPSKNNFCARCGEALKSVASIVGGMPGSGAAVARDAVKMENCPNCKQPNAPDAEVCKRCGLPLSKEISLEDQGDLVVIRINLEQFDFENHRILNPAIKGIMKKKIIIDLSGVKWMDSTGIGTLVTLTYRTARTGQEIKIIGMNDKIFSAVKSLQVDNVLELKQDVNSCRVAWGLPPV